MTGRYEPRPEGAYKIFVNSCTDGTKVFLGYASTPDDARVEREWYYDENCWHPDTCRHPKHVQGRKNRRVDAA